MGRTLLLGSMYCLLLSRHLCKSEVSTKCVILHHKGLCFNFQHLDLPTFRPALYCSPCWSTSYDA